MAINKNKIMDAGRKAYEKGQYDKAIKEYMKVVKEYPKDVRVWLKICELYVKKGARQDATDTYQKVATFYSEQGFYLKAVAVYKQVLKVDPSLVEVNLKLAELYRQLGLMSDAMQHFEMVAAFFHREGKSAEALATLRQLVELDPQNVAARIKLAELYSNEGMTTEAVKEFATTCDQLRKSGRQDDFIKVAERLLFHDTSDIDLCRELANLYLRRNDPRRALAKLQICFKADQNDAPTLALLAQAFQALDQRGKTVSVLKELARVYAENKERRKAESVHRKILEYVPADPDSLTFLGLTASPSALAESVEFEDTQGSQPSSTSHAVSSDFQPATAGRSVIGRTTGSMPLVQPGVGDGAMGESAVPYDPAEDFAADLDEQPGFEGTDQISIVEAEEATEEIVKILTETDVYVKYGLNEKAINHLRRVFEIDDRNVEARERLQAILLDEGREDDAVAELMLLAEHLITSDAERATQHIQSVLSIRPGHTGALQFAERYSLELRPGSNDGLVPMTGDDDLALDELEFEDPFGDAVGVPMTVPQDETSTRRQSLYEFDGPEALNPDTCEVLPSQVEEAILASAGGDYSADPNPLAEPLHHVTPPPLVDDLEFDAEDAAAFDRDAFEASADAAVAVDAVSPVAESTFDSGSEDSLIEELDEEDLVLIQEETGPGNYLDVATPLDPLAGFQGADGTSVTQADEAEQRPSALEDDLDEADFFLSQGMLEEAFQILDNLRQTHPNNPLVAEKYAEAEAARARVDSSPQDFGEPEQTPSVVLERPVEDDDADTHYDLGLACKEMGLYQEAIQAFRKLIGVPGRETGCRLMIGLCLREQGNQSEAIEEFKAGLYVSEISDEEKISLYYEIGATYEALSDPSEALYYYDMIVKKDPHYRDVTDRTKKLRATEGVAGVS